MPKSTKTFASRVSKIDISGIRKAFESAPEQAINLGLGQPDFDTPEHIKRAAIKAIEEGFTGYTPNAGMPELRNAISEKFKKENGISVEWDEIIVTSGASEALHLAIHALAEKGDEVLMPSPCFVSYPALAHLSDARPVGVPLRDDLTMSPEEVEKKITRKTKAFIVNSPANPTGAVQSEKDIKAFAEIADEHRIALISDEVYEHFIYEGKHVSPAKFSDRVVTINATSKTYAMTGWRIGYVAAKKELTEQMLKIHSYIQACAPSISQKASYAALTGPQECVGKMRNVFMERRNLVVDALGKIGVRFAVPHGAFYIFPEVSDERGATAKLLEKKVIVTPGSSFGEYGRNHIRISYAVSTERLKTAMEIVSSVL